MTGALSKCFSCILSWNPLSNPMREIPKLPVINRWGIQGTERPKKLLVPRRTVSDRGRWKSRQPLCSQREVASSSLQTGREGWRDYAQPEAKVYKERDWLWPLLPIWARDPRTKVTFQSLHLLLWFWEHGLTNPNFDLGNNLSHIRTSQKTHSSCCRVVVEPHALWWEQAEVPPVLVPESVKSLFFRQP